MDDLAAADSERGIYFFFLVDFLAAGFFFGAAFFFVAAFFFGAVFLAAGFLADCRVLACGREQWVSDRRDQSEGETEAPKPGERGRPAM